MSSTLSISVVARILLRQIGRGDLPVGRKLSDEAALAQTLGVPESAVRRALCELDAAGVLTTGPRAVRVVARRDQWRISAARPTRRSRAVARSIRRMIYDRALSPGELLNPGDIAKRVTIRCDRRDISDALIELAASGLASPQAKPAGFVARQPQRWQSQL
ncbi:GntR family transcriptional regulator [Streptomyces xanthochromogenes]|uniref:GntR family transcriptional regulator n=1 Tax=Streptomyces TaxID=1883 RepID=UPI00136D28F8|nr:GntR family transcriptional regulator [Streptomyces sp. SID1034]MYV95984.1 GntR family transcriptional regulator [Streptomyces sp. SID1034]